MIINFDPDASMDECGPLLLTIKWGEVKKLSALTGSSVSMGIINSSEESSESKENCTISSNPIILLLFVLSVTLPHHL